MQVPSLNSKIGQQFVNAVNDLSHGTGEIDDALMNACAERGYTPDDLVQWATELSQWADQIDETEGMYASLDGYEDDAFILVTAFAAGLVVDDNPSA